MTGIVILLTVALGVQAGPAMAQLSLDQVIIDFESGKPRKQDVVISNLGEEAAYVLVEPRLVRNPGTENAEKVEIADPRERGLLVSPERLKIAPNSRQRVRFALLARPEDRDRIYRVSIRPTVGDLQTQGKAVKVLVGYDVLVMARPEGAAPDLNVARENGVLTVRNAGRTNALLFRGRQCAPSGDDCKDLPSKRIYAGTSWSTELPYTTPVDYRVKIGGQMERRTF